MKKRKQSGKRKTEYVWEGTEAEGRNNKKNCLEVFIWRMLYYLFILQYCHNRWSTFQSCCGSLTERSAARGQATLLHSVTIGHIAPLIRHVFLKVTCLQQLVILTVYLMDDISVKQIFSCICDNYAKHYHLVYNDAILKLQ